MKTQTVTINRLWNNLASIRDYVIDDLIEKGITLQILLKGTDQVMTLTPEEMSKRKFQISKNKIISHYGSKPYTLIDYAWSPDKPEEMPKPSQEKLF